MGAMMSMTVKSMMMKSRVATSQEEKLKALLKQWRSS